MLAQIDGWRPFWANVFQIAGSISFDYSDILMVIDGKVDGPDIWIMGHTITQHSACLEIQFGYLTEMYCNGILRPANEFCK